MTRLAWRQAVAQRCHSVPLRRMKAALTQPATHPLTRAAASSWSGFSILSRPLPIMWKPPWLR